MKNTKPKTTNANKNTKTRTHNARRSFPSAETHLRRCHVSLASKLERLREYGVLSGSVCPTVWHETSFELLEFYGDAYLVSVA
jgi:hypothetical protein